LNGSVDSSYIRVERVSQSEKNYAKKSKENRMFPNLIELGIFQSRRSSVSIASVLDRPRQAETRLRHVCDCDCGRLLRPLLSFLCPTFGRACAEALTTKFHSLEFSHEGLILCTACFCCQYRVSNIEYRVSVCVASVSVY
jgi:hypothetical protein